jgi:predicted transcriptional regulator
MATVTLTQYAKGKSQAEIARELEVSRAAVSQMLDSEREIYVDVDRRGGISVWEKRSIPARRVTAA